MTLLKYRVSYTGLHRTESTLRSICFMKKLDSWEDWEEIWLYFWHFKWLFVWKEQTFGPYSMDWYCFKNWPFGSDALSIAKDMLRQHEYHEELLSYRNLSMVTNFPFAVVASGNGIWMISSGDV